MATRRLLTVGIYAPTGALQWSGHEARICMHVLTVRTLSTRPSTNCRRTLQVAGSAGWEQLENILEMFHYITSGSLPPTISKPSSRRQVIVVAPNATNLASVATVSSTKLELDREGAEETEETKKPINACRTQTATSCLKRWTLSMETYLFNSPVF